MTEQVTITWSVVFEKYKDSVFKTKIFEETFLKVLLSPKLFELIFRLMRYAAIMTYFIIRVYCNDCIVLY
jgi:hypothetical protein